MKITDVDFECDICGHEFGMSVKGKPSFIECPECGYPCDMRHGYPEDHSRNYDDDDDDDNRTIADV